MEQGQKQFFDWILERVQDGKADELMALLKESFEQQQKGEFDALKLADSGRKMLTMIKPEYVEEFKQAMAHFGQNR